MAPPRKGAGKKLEADLAAACDRLNAWGHNSNSLLPACDRLAGIPCRMAADNEHPFALMTIIEAKECCSASFPLERITRNERMHLGQVVRAHGMAVVVIKHMLKAPRYFATHWVDWLEMEDEIGFVFDSVGRRKSGSASVSLLDGSRPATMLEIYKEKRVESLGACLDLFPLLPAHVVPVARRSCFVRFPEGA